MTIPAGVREAGFIPDGVMEDGTPVTISIPKGQQSASVSKTKQTLPTKNSMKI